MSEWISVKDGLPEDYQSVLVVSLDEDYNWNEWENPVGFAIFKKTCNKGCCASKFDVKTSFYIYEPTHWMPLPIPPKGEKK